MVRFSWMCTVGVPIMDKSSIFNRISLVLFLKLFKKAFVFVTFFTLKKTLISLKDKVVCLFCLREKYYIVGAAIAAL